MLNIRDTPYYNKQISKITIFINEVNLKNQTSKNKLKKKHTEQDDNIRSLI